MIFWARWDTINTCVFAFLFNKIVKLVWQYERASVMHLSVTFIARYILICYIFVTYAASWGVEILLHVCIVFFFQNLHFLGLDILSKFTMQYISVKKKKKKNVALQVSELFFNCILLSTINLIWWKKNEFKFFLDSLTIFLNKFLIRQFFWINFIKLLLSDYTDVSFGVLVTYLSLTKST